MEKEQSHEFDQLRSSIIDQMRNSSCVENKGFRVIQFLILPSFTGPVCWELRRLPNGKLPDEYYLVRVYWDETTDYNAFRDPVERLKHPKPFQPSIHASSTTVDFNKFEAAINKLQRSPIVLTVGKSFVGADGTIYELSFGEYFCSSRISWWESLPEEWKILEEPLQTFLKLCEQESC